MTTPIALTENIADTIPVHIKRHATSKRLSMRYHALRHEIIVIAPKHAGNRIIQAFINRHVPKMHAHIAQLPQRVTFEPGTLVSVLGREYMLSTTAGKTDEREHFVVLASLKQFAPAFTRQCKSVLLAHIQEVLTATWQAPPFADVPYPVSVALRDTQSRWGSCSHTGRLMFSWRLVFAPLYVLDYVILHECCHLIHHNHSAAFWKLCHNLYPSTDEARRWLKNYGKTLFQYGT